MAGCHKKIVVTVPKGYTYKEITVRCGNTSPNGTPWLCNECDEIHGHRDWRREAIMNGEAWDEDDY